MPNLLRRGFPELCLFLFIGSLFLAACDSSSDDDPAEQGQELSWLDVASPIINYINRDVDGSGALFDLFVPAPEDHLRSICLDICLLLFLEPEEVPGLTKITLIIDDFDGVAWKAGDRPEITISISSNHLQNIMNQGKDVLAEITGILFHEITHGYQYDDGGRYGELSSVIEGVADTVRLLAGYIDEDAQNHNGSWTSGYKTTAFFFAWIQDTKRANFLYELNQSLHPDDDRNWSWDDIETLTGETVESLWEQYQDSF